MAMAIFDWFVKAFFGRGAAKSSAPKVAPAEEMATSAATGAATGPATGPAPGAATAQESPKAPVAGNLRPSSIDDQGGPVAAASDPSEIRILLVPFRRDREGKFTQRLAETLKNGQMISVREVAEGPSIPSPRPTTQQAAGLFTEAAAMLEREGADLLILGDLSKAGLRLVFLPSELPPEGRPDNFGLGDALVVSPNFDGTIANLIYATVLSAALLVKPKIRTLLASHLMGAVQQTMGLLNEDSVQESQEQTASVLTFLAVTAATVWRLSGKPEGLEAAVNAYRRALRDGPKEVTPLVVGELKIRLGSALKELGVAKGDLNLFEEAADALESIGAVLSRKTHLREWGLAYQGLGDVLLVRGKQEMESSDCANAIVAFDAALEVFTKEAHLARWIDVMNQRAAAFMIWGAIEAGTKELDGAITAYRAVLAERNQSANPLLWAHASNNLGSAAFALAKRVRNPDLLREAAGCFDSAVLIYEQHGHTSAAEIIRKNIQRVERLQAAGGA